jgi:hypothetical protein
MRDTCSAHLILYLITIVISDEDVLHFKLEQRFSNRIFV